MKRISYAFLAFVAAIMFAASGSLVQAQQRPIRIETTLSGGAFEGRIMPTRSRLPLIKTHEQHLAEMVAAGVSDDDPVPFNSPPRIELSVWNGNPGGVASPFTLGNVVLDRFTYDANNENWFQLYQFEVLSFQTPYGTSTIGRPGAISWFRCKVEQAGWIVIEYWIQGITIQTGPEYHLSGGAIEGRLAFHTNRNHGYCWYETWSTPERIDFSSNDPVQAVNGRVQKGAINGAMSLMFANLCVWKYSTWAGTPNYLIFNQLTVDPVANTMVWQPFESVQPGTDMRFDIVRVRITFPKDQ